MEREQFFLILEFLYLHPTPPHELDNIHEIDFKNVLIDHFNNFKVLQNLCNFLSEKTFSQYFTPFENLSLS